uniref:tRNA (34-2'-O)-methyltransferase regulator WDR6 n=2 Tax=Ceratitis capitata TaxID=7213 RepID=W8BXL6_CERCA
METVLTIADSIAIKLLRGAILTGVGNELHLYSSKTCNRTVLAQRLRAKVHGITEVSLGNIETEGGKIIVHGEKECMLMEYDYTDNEYTFRELNRFQLSDWISSASFLQDSNEFMLLTAHSVVLRILYEESKDRGNSCRIISMCSSSDKSTLYCSHIHGRSFDDLVIFAGNAFGELLIWQPFKGNSSSHKIDCKTTQVELMCRQPAHNGVIFSIDYNDEFDLLTTTSDDRSIRFWKVERKTNHSWSELKLNVLASGYGHIARVFKGKIINCDGTAFAVTVSEDSHTCIWSSSAELLLKKRIQFGAVIWNFEYDSETNTLYSVGSTGNLLALNIENIIKSNTNTTSSMVAMSNLEPKEYVAKAKFIDHSIIVGITNKNRLIYSFLHNNEPKFTQKVGSWQIIDQHKAFKCTVFEVQDKIVAICGYKRLTLLKYNSTGVFKKLFDDNITDGVIRSFHFLDNNDFLISDEDGKCLLIEGEDLKARFYISLPHCKEPWTTSALRIKSKNSKEYLLISNRMGNIILFRLNCVSGECNYLHTIRQLHGALGATFFRLQELQNDNIFVQSAGHDGSLRLLCINVDSDTISAYQRTPVPVTWVEHLIVFENYEFLLGFNDNHFVVWSQEHDFSVQIPCGGGHRCWHYSIISDDNNTKWLQLLFIKNKQLRVYKQKLFNLTALTTKQLRNQWHTRSCNIMSVVEINNTETSASILISAGDDNVIKVTKLMPRNRLSQCAELHSHISNIRALKVLQVKPNKVLIFSGGGRAQLCIAQLNLKSFRIQELLSYTLNKTERNKDERLNSYKINPETRIMACDVIKRNLNHSLEDVEYLVFLCCSDGFLRKVHFTGTFEVVAEVAFHYGCCLLQIRTFGNAYVVTAGTDGKIRFFNSNMSELPIILAHHGSGVNAMDIFYDSNDNCLHIITGGDDQSVSYSSILVQENGVFQIKSKFELENVHSAQVTAVQFIFYHKTLYAYSSGLDQNINKINVQKQTASIICHTTISDIKGLCIGSSKRCFIYGCGIQIFQLE